MVCQTARVHRRSLTEPEPKSLGAETTIGPALLYDDLTIGQRFRSGPHIIGRQRIVDFAREFDPQPHHLSESDAADSRFGTLVASGWHTAAVSMRLFVDALPPIGGGLQGAALEDLAWPKPVLPGDALRVEAEVIWKRVSNSRPQSGLVKIRVITRNQNDEIVQTATHMVIMQK